jgi:DNA (cytosine-5)-methyltransferase 1
MNYNKYTFIDLCCGIGGFHQALSQLDCECVFASDIDINCQKNYELNYNIKPVGDLTKVNIQSIPPFDILCAGFPCQPFSHAGNQKGFDDDRGNIFFKICQIINFHNPKYLILENVKNLYSHDNGNTWKVIKNSIIELGYNLYDDPLILNSLYFNIPHSRERLIILCKRNDLGHLPHFPVISKKFINDQISINSILEIEPNPKYKLNTKLLNVHYIWNDFLNILIDNNIQIPKFPIWTDWWDSNGANTTITKFDKTKTIDENNIIIAQKQIDFYNKYKNWIDKNKSFYNDNIDILKNWLYTSRLNKYWIGSLRKFEWQAGDISCTLDNLLYSTRGSGIRVKKINYTPTLVAMTSMIPIYGPEKRFITPRECARLQSFPENYIIDPNDKHSYKQFGNAVNVTVIKKCAELLLYDIPLFD